MMKAYNRSFDLNISQDPFNYRLSRVRMAAEMVLGKLSGRFRITHRRIKVSIETCNNIIKALRKNF